MAEHGVKSGVTKAYAILYDEDDDGVLSIAVERHDGKRVEIFEYGNDEELAWINLTEAEEVNT